MTTASRHGAPTRRLVASYDSYEDAQRAVDTLSDRGFPVDRVTIVGSDLHLVEQVTGRLTVLRAALAGAATGAWIGVLIGLVFWAVSPWTVSAVLSRPHRRARLRSVLGRGRPCADRWAPRLRVDPRHPGVPVRGHGQRAGRGGRGPNPHRDDPASATDPPAAQDDRL